MSNRQTLNTLFATKQQIEEEKKSGYVSSYSNVCKWIHSRRNKTTTMPISCIVDRRRDFSFAIVSAM